MPPQGDLPEIREESQFATVTLGRTKSAVLSDGNDKEIKKDSDDTFEFDDLLPHVGEFGLYQKILFLLMIPFAFFVAWVYFSQIFITITPERYWCRVPELENLTREERVHLAIPNGEGGLEKCQMYAVNFTELLLVGVTEPDPSWPRKPCDSGYEYNFTTDDVPYASISAEFDWVCENAALPTISQSIFFCGAILGGLVFGWLADSKGRIPALVGTNFVGFAAGVGTAFCNSFWTFCLCRFLVGMAFDNCFTMMYILVLEYVGPKWRTFVANMSIAMFFTCASCVLPWIAWYLEDWRMLCVVTSVPLALAVFTPWCVPESARWLVSQGQIDKSIGILKKFERINGTKVEESMYKQFRDSCYKAQKEEEDSKSYSVIDLFKTPHLRKITLLLILIWMAISLVFDGHVRNVGSLGLNVFLTFTIASATELPADTFLTITLDRWGRRWLAFGTMAMSGIFSLLATTVPLGIPSATMAIIGRFAINITYNIGLQYAAELLPTVVRAQGVALIHIMGYVASIVAPFVVYLATISPSFPLIILGIVGILGGCLALFLPETLGHELPQTLQDGETFGRDQKFLDFPCKSRSEGCVKEQPEKFRRTGSLRASFRGEARSSIINRSSLRARNPSSI
ncbi:hypothetical protein PPYR_12493 [Photinus pyralis]|uniref:Major facilitator superfamily (MFS) profile domain-containing protein n=1 Tax=Photinus pyralis TaxID=7054 RepID=A0A1Y1LPP5_PHOPY|nr:organic cation transporter protein [Photinus pyralis]KAB0795654.1 hypothetical protein PPYR_12493 [Photinus pyralis]